MSSQTLWTCQQVRLAAATFSVLAAVMKCAHAMHLTAWRKQVSMQSSVIGKSRNGHALCINLVCAAANVFVAMPAIKDQQGHDLNMLLCAAACWDHVKRL